MIPLNLSTRQKSEVQKATDIVLENESANVDVILVGLLKGDEASWRRFLSGVYNHPVT
ncbi:hypothetical protein GNX18_00670 [Microbulbifer sp. SH-1]|uniref:hypothetical protein n=1 Tax=Microbulbifer sp. SH-1 TaxID=2681547 RepID=UPI00140C64BF|nr:hypothetical protein [Microbulbifer sp. SH-1]QIL88445.1 hypothetical protein GNX18_00665 [Microbulbifer sp. SH-1]QIL88446.1 hypothetical protein GNX18_00670 [Microbulbifer sp. SH-1]